jgi:hypothetical protein
MKWIVEILEIEPYTITCLWNDQEIRAIDLTNFINEKSQNPRNSYSQLKDKDRFVEAKCDGTTIYWENGIKMRDYDGIEKFGQLDIDPDILFEMSYRLTEKTTSGNK